MQVSDEVPQWDEIEESIRLIKNAAKIKLNNTFLFDEFALTFFGGTLDDWNINHVSLADRWLDVYKSFKNQLKHLFKIVKSVLA